ncbi:MAG: TRAP transporter substrate-binding protein DctP [Pararhodobacter sp.]|nr:TRAP transporter substrate-binding protein DctP [Pararhodobacter sp.]
MSGLVALTAAALIVGAANAQTTISYATHIPSSHALATNAIEPMVARLAAHEDAPITLQVHYAGAVAAHGAVLTGVQDGLVDSGFLADVYAPQELPNSTMISFMTLAGPDARVMSGVASEVRLLHCPGCVEELAEMDQFLLSAMSLSPQFLFCTRRVEAVADLRGLQIATPAATGRFFAELGAVPTNMPITDSYEALGRGQIDCVTGVETFLRDYSFWDHAKYVLDLSLGTFHGAITVMSQVRWNQLSEAERAALMAEQARMTAEGAFAYHEAAVEVRHLAETEHGVTFVTPAADLVAAHEAALAAEAEAAIEQGTRRGAQNPEAIVEAFQASLDRWTAIVDEIGDDREAFAAALQREIFDQVSH